MIVASLALACSSGSASPRAGRPGPGPADAAVPVADASHRAHPSSDKHWDLDLATDGDGGIAPRSHTEQLWGDYIDRDGKPAVGWHSHDPETGNAR